METLAPPTPELPAPGVMLSHFVSQYLLDVKDVSDLPAMYVKPTPAGSAAAVSPPLDMRTLPFLLVELHVVAI